VETKYSSSSAAIVSARGIGKRSVGFSTQNFDRKGEEGVAEAIRTIGDRGSFTKNREEKKGYWVRQVKRRTQLGPK
jgi:hypothetical protein